MKRYRLDELKVGMKVYVDELHSIEGVYIVLGNPKSDHRKEAAVKENRSYVKTGNTA